MWSPSNQTPPQISEDTLIYFVAFCETQGLRHTTIKQYLAGIKFHYTTFNIECPLHDTTQLARLQIILRGVKRSQCNVAQNRLPITVSILRDMLAALDNGVLGYFNSSMLAAACTMAFFAFLRCGEFTVRNNAFDPTSNLRISDIQMHSRDTSYVLTLKSSKADVFRRGVHISVHATGDTVCPVQRMKQYMSLRTSAGATKSDPLFINDSGLILNREYFINCVKSVLTQIGLDAMQYNGHSFRIGAATSAGKAQIPDHLIQVLGRWSSDCYAQYIRTDESVKRRALLRISQTL